MKEFLSTITDYIRNVQRLAMFSLLLIVIFCQFIYAERHVSQFGITWKFDRDYTVGQFANGDYWVLGPVTIIGIDPPSTQINGRTINGSMVNPSPKLRTKQGYDSAMFGKYGRNGRNFITSLNVGRPNNQDLSERNSLVLKPHSSLVSTISIPEAEHRPQLRAAAILTILPEPAPEGSFRPPYCGSDKTIKFNKDQLDYSLLANLKPVPGAPGIMVVERYFERPWIDHIPGWLGRFHHPAENMPDYGREIAIRVSVGALKLNLDLNNQMKEVLLIRYVQLGIDLYGIVRDGGKRNWINNGGCASGCKWPILFAGILLNDPAMKNIGRNDIENYGSSHPEYVHFGEDDQTFYISDEDIYEPPYQKHIWHGGFVYYGHGKGDKRRDYLEYTQEHLGMPEWGIEHATKPNQDGLDWNTSYRQSCTANAWAGYLLAAHIMGVKELWNHDVLFDYMDRFMQVQKEVVGADNWKRQRPKFVRDMWDAYRADYGPVWTMSPMLKIVAVGGSVIKIPDKAVYDLGQKVILKAVADNGYQFTGWSGGFSGTGNPVTIIMHANRTVTANFEICNNTKKHNSK
jgi:uncharacterized repeat protein (TIGR02543 family)